MKIRFNDLKNKMSDLSALLLTHPSKQDDLATEIWIKFKNEGFYIYIDFEYPLKTELKLETLGGAGNSLNCSDYKKDNELLQYGSRSEVLDILKRSDNFRGNNNNTLRLVVELVNSIPSNYF